MSSPREVMRQRYIALRGYNPHDPQAQALAHLRLANEQLHSAQRQFIFGARNQFVHINSNHLQEIIHEQYQKLTCLPKVKAVRVSASNLFVFTQTLFARLPDDNKHYELGEFLIWICLAGPSLKMFNQTRQVHAAEPSMHAPCIFADGTLACANIEEAFCESLAEFDFASMVELAIEFAETPVHRGLAKFIGHWPQASQQGDCHVVESHNRVAEGH